MNDDLRKRFQDAAHSVAPPPVAEILERARGVHQRRVRKVAGGGTLLLVIVLLAGFLAFRPGKSPAVNVATGPSPAVPAPTTTATSTPTPSLAVESPMPSATSAGAASQIPLQSVRWAVAVLPPLGCGYPPGSTTTAQVFQVSYVQPAPGLNLAVVLATCTAGAGTPSKGLYVYDRATSITQAHLFQTLVDPSLERQSYSFTVSGSTISMREAAYSSWNNVPQCCPDLDFTVKWTWVNQRYVGSPSATSELNPLRVTVTSTSPSANVGSTVGYTVSVADSGATPVSNVQVDLVLPLPPCSGEGCGAGQYALAWESGSPSCSNDPSFGEIVCRLADLSPGSSGVVSFTMRVETYLNPLTFQPVVFAVLSGGAGSSPRLSAEASATISVQH